jgi:general secretion pathway protein L
MNEMLVIELPAMPDRNRAETHWWRVADGAVRESGSGGDWTHMLVDMDGDSRRLVALAPASAARVSLAESPTAAATPRQAEAIARIAAVEASLGDPQTLHAVSVSTGDAARPIMTAVADNGAMLAWIEWLGAFGADPDHVVPVAALLPASDQWLEARFGSQLVVGRGGLIMPHELALSAAVIGDAEISSLDRAQADTILAAAAMSPPLDLRTGPFARRKRWAFDRDQVRQLALLAATIPLIALLWALVVLVKLNGATGRLDDETLRVAEAALGRPATLENAEAELRARVGGAGFGGFQPSLAALFSGLQAEQGVTSTELGYRPDGTLAVTLAAPTIDAINRLLVAVQRSGYRITAVPRQSPDGRAMVDITIRSGP